mmetsp:Transcript_30660/g.64963  ORF Transcript_30660/g.64963 Transcript_30660/m.64963 type:complete len:95 (+) Transcript_30660:60-344(+)
MIGWCKSCRGFKQSQYEGEAPSKATRHRTRRASERVNKGRVGETSMQGVKKEEGGESYDEKIQERAGSKCKKDFRNSMIRAIAIRHQSATSQEK